MVVEVPAIVNVKGIQPLRVQPLPPKLMLEQILPLPPGTGNNILKINILCRPGRARQTL